MVKLIDQDQDVLVFAGHVIPGNNEVPQNTIQVKMAKSSINNVHPKFTDFFTYVTTPRYKGEVYQAIVNFGGNISDIDRMLANGQFRAVPAGNDDVSLDSLSGLKLVPLAHKVKIARPESSDHLVYLGNEENTEEVYPVSSLFSAVLWEENPEEDFPTTVRRKGIELGERSDRAIRGCLIHLDEVLAQGLARWENLTDPVIAPFQPTIATDKDFHRSYKGTNPFTRLKALLKI